MEATFMQTVKRTAEERYRLVMKRRSSGLSDFQWCNEHGIKPGTFYNWVKRLRKKACYDFPPATGRGGYKPSKQQDVVKLEIVDQPVLREETPPLLSSLPGHTETNCMEATAEIKLGPALIRLSPHLRHTDGSDRS